MGAIGTVARGEKRAPPEVDVTALPWPERRSDWRCRVCGYGIVVAGRLPECPMCRSDDWAGDERRSDVGAPVCRSDDWAGDDRRGDVGPSTT
jgi:hypothetical protein